MKTQDIAQLWLDAPLAERDLEEDELPAFLQGRNAHLFIRELPVDEGASLINACRNKMTGEIDQGKLVVGIVIKTLRNRDDPDGSLVFSMPMRDALIKKGLGPIQTVGNMSIILSGLNQDAAANAKNGLTPTTMTTTQENDSSSS